MKHKRHSAKKSTVKHRRFTSTKHTRKNPPPQFYNTLESLIGKEVTVYSKSDLGYFHIIGVLEKMGHLQYQVKNSIIKIRLGQVIVLGQVRFRLNIITKIYENNIELRSSTKQELRSGDTTYSRGISHRIDFTEKLDNLKNINNIKINFNMYIVTESINAPFVYAKLKYNRKDNIFYAGTPDTKNFVSFKPEAIVDFHGIPYSGVYINI